MGGGPIGCELAQCFARFGSSVTQVEMGPRILSKEDPDISAQVAAKFKILGTIHIYPTLAEANRYAAAEWRLAHQPRRLFKWIERLHAWRH